MKFLIFTLLSMTIAYGQTCEELVAQSGEEYIMLQDLEEIEGILFDYSSAPLFSNSLMTDENVVTYIGEFEQEECESALSQVDVLVNDSILEFVYTSEDNCDGGNSYGYILENNTVVGVITDSEINCLN